MLNFTVSGFEFLMHYMLWFLGLFLRYKYSVYIFLVIKVCGLFFRGKGDNYRLGHGTEDHARHPKQIEALSSKKVKDIAIGSLHCMAITEDGELYGWGRNEQGQLGNPSISNFTEPTLIGGMEGKNIIGVACGPTQVRKTKADYHFLKYSLFRDIKENIFPPFDCQSIYGV